MALRFFCPHYSFFTFHSSLAALSSVQRRVRLRASGVPGSHGVTGGVYKARERIHRGMLIRDY